MRNVKEYIDFASKNLIPSDVPLSAQELMEQLIVALGMPKPTPETWRETNYGMLGRALSTLKVKWSYRYIDRHPDSDKYYPKKLKQYFVSVSVGNGNLVIDKQKIYRRRAKAKKTRVQNLFRNKY